MSSSNHFHLTLPSNASMDIYPNNTIAQYVTKLPRRIELNGDWSVSLKEISTPLAFCNIRANYYKLTVKSNEMEEPEEFVMQEGNYLTEESIIDELNRLVYDYQANVRFGLVMIDGVNVRFRLLTANNVAVRLNRALANLLGMGSDGIHDFTNSAYTAPTPIDIPFQAQITTLYVYCNILEHVIVGDKTAPLLRVVEGQINEKKTRMHDLLNAPLFVPVQKKSFDTIEMWIMTDTGHPVPFSSSSGKSHVVLEFKKSGLLDSLI